MVGLKSACASSATETTNQAKTRELAEGCLRGNPYLALKNVSCDYQNGVAVLRGCLPTYYLKQVAQEVVAHQQGVDKVKNQIQVLTPAYRPSQG
jgi:osmotically-inducible protein OsmY